MADYTEYERIKDKLPSLDLADLYCLAGACVDQMKQRNANGEVMDIAIQCTANMGSKIRAMQWKIKDNAVNQG